MTKHKHDTTYFNTINTEEKAYFLGFVYADGCNTGRGLSIKLNEKDRHILETFSMAMFGYVYLYTRPPRQAKIKDRIINGGATVEFNVRGQSIVTQMVRLGVVRRKSLVLQFPTPSQVPAHLLRHFMRGYFDGDGCLSHRTANSAKRYIATVISSHDFCTAFVQYVNPLLDVNFTFVKKSSKIDAVNLSGNRQIKRFMDWIYADATICLVRKFTKYKELCQDIHRMNTKPSYSTHNNISYDKSRGKWTAAVRAHKRTKHLGRYATEAEALAAQRNYIKQLETASTSRDELPESSLRPAAAQVQSASSRASDQPLLECDPLSFH